MSAGMNLEEGKLSKIELLESAPHFSFLNFGDKNVLVVYMTIEEFLPGDPLIHEGEIQDKTHFIFEGKAEVVKASAEGERVSIAKVGRGDIVGEAALQPNLIQSTVVVRALDKTKTLCLPRNAFEEMMIDTPQTAFKLLFDVIRLLRRRLNETSNKFADHVGDIIVDDSQQDEQ